MARGAQKAGHRIKPSLVAFEAAAVMGFWLSALLRARDIEAHVIHASSVAVSREHRRARPIGSTAAAQTRLSRLGCAASVITARWWRSPTIKDEDAKRPNRERESLVGEQNRIHQRMKATLIRLGIRGFNPKLKKAAERLEGLRTPEGEPIRSTPWLSCIATWSPAASSVIRRQIENCSPGASQASPSDGPHAMVAYWRRVIGVGMRRPTCCAEVLRETARPTGGSALCRSHWLARRDGTKRREEGLGPFGQRSGSAGNDPIWRGDFSCSRRTVPWAVVFKPAPRTRRGTQAMVVALARNFLNRPVAVRCERRCAGRASFCVQHMNGDAERHPTVSAQSVHCDGVADDGFEVAGSRGDSWLSCREEEWVAVSSFAADAHRRIMVGFLHPPNTRLWRD